MARLDDHGVPPTRFLLVDFLDLVVTSAGIVEAAADQSPPAERQDLAAALSSVLVRGMREWAQTVREDPDSPGDYTEASEGIARTVADFLLVSLAGPPGDLEPRLEAFRTVAAAMPRTTD
jgi:hypothetical protein